MNDEKLTQKDDNAPDFRRINMALTEHNVNFLNEHTKKLYINRSHLINSIVRNTDPVKLHDYLESQPFRKGNHPPRQKGHPMTRLNLKFPIDVYNFITNEAKVNDTTATQLLNMILELYAKSISED